MYPQLDPYGETTRCLSHTFKSTLDGRATFYPKTSISEPHLHLSLSMYEPQIVLSSFRAHLRKPLRSRCVHKALSGSSTKAAWYRCMSHISSASPIDKRATGRELHSMHEPRVYEQRATKFRLALDARATKVRCMGHKNRRNFASTRVNSASNVLTLCSFNLDKQHACCSRK